MMSKQQKIALVTGASSGIGHAIAQQLLGNGYHVVGMARDFSKASHSSSQFVPLEIDFSDLDSLPAFLQTFTKKYPRIDALVCCAGQGQFGGLEEFSFAQIAQLMNINFTSQAFVVRALVPLMKKHKSGNIVFMGSEAALQGGPKGAIYSASKSALRGMAQALRAECAKNGVRVSVINPGMVKTPFFDQLSFEPGAEEENFLLPETVAEMVALILDSPPHAVFDEVNLSPLKKVVAFKPRPEKP